MESHYRYCDIKDIDKTFPSIIYDPFFDLMCLVFKLKRLKNFYKQIGESHNSDIELTIRDISTFSMSLAECFYL